MKKIILLFVILSSIFFSKNVSAYNPVVPFDGSDENYPNTIFDNYIIMGVNIDIGDEEPEIVYRQVVYYFNDNPVDNQTSFSIASNDFVYTQILDINDNILSGYLSYGGVIIYDNWLSEILNSNVSWGSYYTAESINELTSIYEAFGILIKENLFAILTFVWPIFAIGAFLIFIFFIQKYVW